ncbi:AT-hook motif nuclear-localized protein 23-like [Cucurbita pepo subsp. pepo]|uniref:AT-hook motif nuclear-localized protein 23-like n=1 Tax=Cucurbita pepo subsp. pepo TaxID=3664 RepID=UPI000C9D62B8|nr:AT-hook motif nuclear-localized protein 23-like [Cucurbita pepo subsp. pepo]
MSGLDLGFASHFVNHLQRRLDADEGYGQFHDGDEDHNNAQQPNSGGDIMGRRPRGRPPGSKNKPKPPVIITRESVNTLQAHVLEVNTGCNVFDSIATYARKCQRGICILSGTGTVTNVNLRQPATGSAVITLYDRYSQLSLWGLFLPPPALPGVTSLSIFLAGGQGQVIGGKVVGSLIAYGPVIVIASSFTNVSYERLPLDDGGGGGGGGGRDPSGGSVLEYAVEHVGE